MSMLGQRSILASLVVAATLTGSPAQAAGEFNLVELSFKTRFGKPIELHFAPTGGFTQKACKASLKPAIAEFSPNLNKAFEKNYGGGIDRWVGATFVKGECRAFDFPPGQTFKLKLSGQ